MKNLQLGSRVYSETEDCEGVIHKVNESSIAPFMVKYFNGKILSTDGKDLRVLDGKGTRKVFKERLKMSNGETVLGGIGLGFFARVFGGIVSIGEGDIPMSLSKHAKTRETGIFGAIDIVGNDLRYIENYKYEAQ